MKHEQDTLPRAMAAALRLTIYHDNFPKNEKKTTLCGVVFVVICGRSSYATDQSKLFRSSELEASGMGWTYL